MHPQAMMSASRRLASALSQHRGFLAGVPKRAFSAWVSVETPNPNVRKFEPPGSVGESLSFSSGEARQQLLAVEGVRDVFVVGMTAAQPASGSRAPAGAGEKFVSVTREAGADWADLAPRVQTFLAELPVAPSEHADASSTGSAAAAPVEEGTPAPDAPAAEGIEAEIMELLEHRIRPSVQADGGDIDLASWDAATGEVKLYLRGACRGCPQSAVTLQESIFRTLSHFIPEVQSVTAAEEEGYDERMAEQSASADLPFEHSGEADPKAVQALSAGGTPFFSMFMGTRMEGAKLKRVRFVSRLELAGRTPAHLHIKCKDCNVRTTMEDPNDLLLQAKGNETGKAALVICPVCCVLISK
eukprot:TRINITY_DN33863_c0_g1_i1.p1 TRINITY_DN33863_c0_g1~~TRINITY_DN33863_c0_g1_i1.p1  ORF type:complete len:357 (+),score=87.88 TRINITY_DN33863_c0_g1_i1:60-1130(+)